jgi:hypothetical protein
MTSALTGSFSHREFLRGTSSQRRSPRLILRCAVLYLLIPLCPLLAQSADSARSPRDCIHTMGQLTDDARRAARDAGKRFDREANNKAVTNFGTKCAARFDLATIAPDQLMALAELYARSGMLAHVDSVFDRIGTDTGISDSARFDSYINAGSVFGNALSVLDSSGKVRARQTVIRLALKGDAVARDPLQKFKAQAALAYRWAMDDDSPEWAERARNVISLAKTLPDSLQTRPEIAASVLTNMLTVAIEMANNLQPDSAMALLREASNHPALSTKEFTEKGGSYHRERIDNAITRFSLIGRSVPEIKAEYTVNGSKPPMTGKVSVIMFTAHWCHPCALSYPTIVRMTKELAPRGFQSVIMLELEGSYGGETMTPEQEVEANKKYYNYNEKQGFTSPLVFQAPLRIKLLGQPRPKDHDNSDVFGVTNLPTYVVVDRKGIIRAILNDWDPKGERGKVLASIVDRLLSE